MQRNSDIDTMKGIGIICVIIGHTTSIYSLRNIIYSFHMPLFFFISGYLFHYKANLVLIKSVFKKLIYPYLIFSLVIILTSLYNQHNFNEEKVYNYLKMIIFANGYYNHAKIWNNIPPIGILWFLPALFWCRTLYNTIYRYPKSIFISIVISIIAIYVGKNIINLPLGILLGSQAIIFYMIGHQYLILRNQIPQTTIFYILVTIVWLLISLTNYFSMADFTYSNWILNIIGATTGILIIHKISCNIKGSVKKLLSWYGKNSLYILGFHAIFSQFAKPAFQYDKIEWIIPAISQITAITIIVLITNKIIKA